MVPNQMPSLGANYYLHNLNAFVVTGQVSNVTHCPTTVPTLQPYSLPVHCHCSLVHCLWFLTLALLTPSSAPVVPSHTRMDLLPLLLPFPKNIALDNLLVDVRQTVSSWRTTTSHWEFPLKRLSTPGSGLTMRCSTTNLMAM
jgi:hypothetical protein